MLCIRVLSGRIGEIQSSGRDFGERRAGWCNEREGKGKVVWRLPELP